MSTLKLTPGIDSGQILDAARRHGIAIFGAGMFARDLAHAATQLGIKVEAFVVTQAGSPTVHDRPLVGLDQLTDTIRQLPLWVGVFNHRPESDYAFIAQRCREHGIADPVFPQQFFDAVAPLMGWRYWLTESSNYARHAAEIEHAYDSLADQESQLQFAATLAFRHGGNPATAPQPDSAPQYFPADIVNAASVARQFCFVDAGAYDGDTLTQAIAHLPLGSAVAFEPDPRNFLALARNIEQMPIPVTGFPCGVSSSTQILSFSSGNGEASAIGNNGESSIQVVSMDDCLHNHPVGFIKLDIEGHELDALTGASRLIVRHRPIVAVAAYHKWDDIWRIPQFFQELNCGYRLAYRTHEYNTFESVFYAYIPQ